MLDRHLQRDCVVAVVVVENAVDQLHQFVAFAGMNLKALKHPSVAALPSAVAWQAAASA